MRIQVGRVMFANAVGGGGACADTGAESEARVRSTTMSAVRILMRHVKSNRSARRVFAETLENAREKGRGQRAEPEGDPTEMFRQV
jgi:hypothetical protein